jgi:hypothetical protein
MDSATAHTADESLTALEGEFDDIIINRGLWPARSPYHMQLLFMG